MIAIRLSRKIKVLSLPLGIAGAAAAMLLASGTMSTSAVAKSSPDRTAADAQAALAKGKYEKAIELSEAVVAASPREPAYRALLGQAYLKAGRFDSAASAFNDAMKLGENSARTALGLALANTAAGRNREAVAILDDWRDAIPAADLGLALALAGETSRGVAILADALRNGDNSVKLRQNLAYAYALDGRWREARIMAAQDVPANQLDDRISDWAARAKPEDSRLRVAGLIKAPLRADPGQPVALALAENSTQEQLAAETAAARTVPTSELPAAAVVAEAPAPVEAPAALAEFVPVTPVPVAAEEPDRKFAAAFTAPVGPESVPDRASRAAKAVRVATAAGPVRRVYTRPHNFAATGKGTHLVQLGSFSSAQGARRAWGIYAAKNHELRSYRMTITAAVVHGKNFWRVAAAGFDAGSASGLCSKVKGRGGVCFAYAASRVLPTGKPLNAPAMALARPVARPLAKAEVRVASAQGAAGSSSARRR